MGSRPGWFKKILKGIGNFFKSTGTTQNGGLPMDSESAQGTPDKAKFTEDIGSIESFLTLIS